MTDSQIEGLSDLKEVIQSFSLSVLGPVSKRLGDRNPKIRQSENSSILQFALAGDGLHRLPHSLRVAEVIVAERPQVFIQFVN